MARALRIDIENGLDHVTSRGWERRVMVGNDADVLHRNFSATTDSRFGQPGLRADGQPDLERFAKSKLREPLPSRMGCSQVVSWLQVRRRVKTSFARKSADFPSVSSRGKEVSRIFRRRGNDGRLAAISLCHWLTDQSVGTIGDYFGGVSTPAISKAEQRAEIHRSQDRAWERQLKRLMAGIRSSR